MAVWLHPYIVLMSDCQLPVFVGDVAYFIAQKSGKNMMAAERNN